MIFFICICFKMYADTLLVLANNTNFYNFQNKTQNERNAITTLPCMCACCCIFLYISFYNYSNADAVFLITGLGIRGNVVVFFFSILSQEAGLRGWNQ